MTHLVSDKTINLIVTHLFENVNLDWLAREFSEAIPNVAIPNVGRTGDFCRDLGNALFEMNAEAVRQRRGGLIPDRYAFAIERASDFEVYNAITELKYQCCEGTVPSTKLFRLLTTMKAAVADALVKGQSEREKELVDELENSLYARCEACCRGRKHGDAHCGAPTARRLLAERGRIVYDANRDTGGNGEGRGSEGAA